MKTFGYQWHVHELCNLHCRHCYQQGSEGSHKDDFAAVTKTADRVFKGLADRRVSINLTGGEPLVYQDLFPLVDYLSQFPNLQEISIITNGTRLDPRTVSELNRHSKIRSLKVSLEAPSARINDSIRGRGNFDRVRQNLRYFVDNSATPVVLMTTLNRQNVHLIPETVDFAISLGLAGVVFERFVPLGRGKKMIDQSITADLWEDAVGSILKCAGLEIPFDQLSFHELLPYKAFWLTLEKRRVASLEGALCNLGEESMALMPGGVVYPCRRLPIEVGNVLTDPMEVILSRLSDYEPKKNKSRLNGTNCPSCEIALCAGCRAIAYAICGDPLADDPSCPRSSTKIP